MKPYFIDVRSKRSFLCEPSTVVESSFLSEPKRTKHEFLSMVCLEGKNSITTSEINFERLIFSEYPSRVFKIFIKYVLSVPNIIIEEEAVEKLGQKVQRHPRKCFSVRLDRSLSETEESREGENASSSSNVVLRDGTSSLGETMTSQSSQKPSLAPRVGEADLESLTEEQIRSLVEQKMRPLDAFNRKLEARDRKRQPPKLSESQTSALVRFQRRFRELLIRKNFFKSLRMNDYLENKKSLAQLKKCLDRFQKIKEIC